MRKLVTLRKVSKLSPIEGADVIELAHVDGWQCVVKKGEFEEGDWGIYFEIDSMIPYAEWNKHLFKHQKDIDRGFLRIKTITLRGQLSQGLMLPLPLLLDYDLTEAVGVYKYEPPQPEDLSAKSRFPSFATKTDEIRVQNHVDDLPEWRKKLVYVSEKLDGSSITIHCVKDELIGDGRVQPTWVYGVSSRNLELKLEVPDENDILVPSQNKFVNTARDLKLYEKMLSWCTANDKDLVLQGELIGTGIQGNKYGLHGYDIRFFTAQDGKGKQLPYGDFYNIIQELNLVTVPILEVNWQLPDSYERLLAYADAKSTLNDVWREGVVIRAMDGSFSFKVISNKFLIENKE